MAGASDKTSLYAEQGTLSHANSFNELKEEELSQYFEIAKTSVEKYYLSTTYTPSIIDNEYSQGKKIIGDNLDSVNLNILDDLNLDKLVGSYLKAKQQYETGIMLGLDYKKTYLCGRYTISRSQIVEDNLICYVLAELNFNYSDSDLDSATTRLVQVVFKKPSESSNYRLVC